MATQQTTTAGRVLVTPSVILLFVWMIVPLVMTLYFSTLRYSLLDPDSVRLRRACRTIPPFSPIQISSPLFSIR